MQWFRGILDDATLPESSGSDAGGLQCVRLLTVRFAQLALPEFGSRRLWVPEATELARLGHRTAHLVRTSKFTAHARHRHVASQRRRHAEIGPSRRAQARGDGAIDAERGRLGALTEARRQGGMLGGASRRGGKRRRRSRERDHVANERLSRRGRCDSVAVGIRGAVHTRAALLQGAPSGACARILQLRDGDYTHRGCRKSHIAGLRPRTPWRATCCICCAVPPWPRLNALCIRRELFIALSSSSP